MITNSAIACVAGLHILFLLLEMLFWTRPAGRRLTGLSAEQARQTAVLAANQGLYNGFLAAGLLWGLLDTAARNDFLVFLLCCVVVAGVFGALTASRMILWIQALPGLAALLLVLNG